MALKVYKITPLLILLFLFACRNNTEEKESSDTKEDLTITVSKEQFQASEMALGLIEIKPFPALKQATGMIEVPPQNKAVVSALMGGYIKETPLLIGDKVKKGQVLLTLENPEFITLQQNYLESKQQLGFLQAEFERQKQLVEEKITSQKNFLKAESDYKGKLALYNGLRQKLIMLNIPIAQVEAGNIRSVLNIYAPISGSVTKMLVSKGMYVSPADEILEITDNDHIHLELQVFEKDIMTLKIGQNIVFTIPEASNENYGAEVYLIGTHIEENRTVRVHAHLKDEEDNRFLTGMFVEAQIETSEIEKPALPTEALAEINNDVYVLKLISEDQDKYVFEQLRVKSEHRHEGYSAVELTEEKDKDATYLVKGAFSLFAA
ncbi:MAG: efflux RND transporter periplasmic adaptor subunit, partial [Flavobacteriaceae bacterium]|nr:efflux RND transporter periplasmic adaptor subunit [Muriicola sp.]NNL39138.1 efflux RND transporter periplasmic adaptor subunit [Flavobacteriaceae bacterium]